VRLPIAKLAGETPPLPGVLLPARMNLVTAVNMEYLQSKQ
jgi:hypothetical protein